MLYDSLLMVVLMAGLPGTGKTTLARELALRTAGRVLSKDEFRHSIFLDAEIEYSSRQDDFVLQLMLETAGLLLQRNPSLHVFLDGRPFSRRYQIENVIAAADSMHQPWRIIECICPGKLAQQRLELANAKSTHPAANRNYELYQAVKDRFEFIAVPKTQIDTAGDLDDCVREALRTL